MPNETSLYKQYLDLVKQVKAKHPKGIVLFRVGDFFEIFFEDALMASTKIGIVLTSKSVWMGEKVPMCGVPVSNVDHYIGKLLALGYSVALADQVESAKEAKTRGASLIKREVIRIYTKGTLIEEEYLNPNRHSYLCALSPLKGSLVEGSSLDTKISPKNLSQATLSVAWADVSTKDFFVKNIKAINLDHFLGHIQPSEIILSKTTLSHFQQFLDSQDADVTILPDSKFDLENLKDLLQNYYAVPSLNIINLSNKSDIVAVGAVIDYITLAYAGSTQNLSSTKPLLAPKIIDHQALMKIDQNTLKQLEIVQSINRKDRMGTLLWAIDQTITAAGGRLFHHHLVNPITDLKKIQARQYLIQFFISHPKELDSIRTILHACPDLERSLTRLSNTKPNIRELKSIALSIHTSLQIKVRFNTHSIYNELPSLLMAYLPYLGQFADTSQTILKALEETLPKKMEDGYFIRTGFDATLDEFRSIEQSFKQKLIQLENTYGSTTQQNLKIKNNNLLGYFIETKQPLKDTTFIHRQSTVSLHRYTTKELINLSHNLVEAKQKSLTREIELFQELRNFLIQNQQDLKMMSLALALIDWGSAGAYLANKYNYCKPQFTTKQALHIQQGRHPVLEIVHKNQHQPFQSNDCSMNESHHTYMITGPNMAGKSTYLRQVALIVWLAHTGYYVSATSCNLSTVDLLKSRIGASDDLAKGMSTFMLEMVDVASILHQATPKSLIILDEIGRGTSTFDGMAIAEATLEYLHQHIGCHTLFATHYLELVSMQQKHPSLQLYTMDIKGNADNITFTHCLIPGSSKKSYGLYVAKMAGLPHNVIQNAKHIQQYWEKNMTQQYHHNKDQLTLPFQPPSSSEVLSFSAVIEQLRSLDTKHITPQESMNIVLNLCSQLKNK